MESDAVLHSEDMICAIFCAVGVQSMFRSRYSSVCLVWRNAARLFWSQCLQRVVANTFLAQHFNDSRSLCRAMVDGNRATQQAHAANVLVCIDCEGWLPQPLLRFLPQKQHHQPYVLNKHAIGTAASRVLFREHGERCSVRLIRCSDATVATLKSAEVEWNDGGPDDEGQAQTLEQWPTCESYHIIWPFPHFLASSRRQSAARNEAHHEVKLKLSFNEDSEQEEELLLEFISDSYWWEEHNQAVGGVAPSGLDSTGGPATSLEELLDILQWS